MKIDGEREYKVEVGGVPYGMDRIESGTLTQALFDAPGVGNTACASFTMTFLPTEAPPRMGEVRPYIRDAGEEEWTPLGVFWIDQRSQQDGRMTVTCYDGMLKAERTWKPGEEAAFPMTMEQAAKTIAAAMGTALDSRCSFNSAYTVDYPAEQYTMREALGYIAAAHGGNWLVTARGELLLAPLFGSMPAETHYLIEEQEGAAITFGGVRILV